MSKRDGFHDFLLRVPDDLWREFVAAAKREDRTATQQMVNLIRQFVGQRAGRPRKKGKP